MADTFTAIPEGYTSSGIDRRLFSVQALRAIAALLVVWVHSIDAAEVFNRPRQSNFFHWENYGACGVDIFFAISGFIVSRVAVRAVAAHFAANETHFTFSAARVFFTRRITRVFPLYWILTAVVVLEAELGRYNVHWHSVNWLPTIFLFPSLHSLSNVPLLSLGWSLMFEMYFYAVLAAFMLWTPKSIVRNTMVFLCGMVVLGLGIGIHRPVLAVWMNPMLLEFVFGCCIGLVYSRYGVGSQRIHRAGIWIGIGGAILLVASIFTGYGGASEQGRIMRGDYCWLRVGVWGIPAALLVGGVIFWNPAMRSFPARFLVFLGDASYSIYLCTIPARSFVEHYWRIFGRFGLDAGVFFGALFCTAVGVVCYLVLERPMMRAFHNWYKPMPFRTAV